MKSYETAIIGGGAAGLTAAVMLARQLCRPQAVLLLEKLPRVGKKLLATGNGTCNISNAHADGSHYHGDSHLADSILRQFTPADTVRFFDSIGVVCVQRADGKYYPRCEQAAAVLDCLRMEAELAGVQTQCDAAVTAITKTAQGFRIQTAQTAFFAKTVLVCTGGAAAPSLGGDVSGYALLTALGHVRTALFPSIVQLRTDTAFVRAMQGLRLDATATITDGKQKRSEYGEVLFTAYGLSGPAIMQISRIAADWERQKHGTCTVSLDLFPECSPADVRALLEKRCASSRRLEDFFTGLLHKRIGQTVIRAAGLSLSDSAADLDAQTLDRLAHLLKNWEFPVTGTQGFGGAQVTAGGIDTKDFDPDTLQSRLVPGLFAAGELLNVDGDCGGFNLQFAFSCAFAATQGILKKLRGISL